MLRTTPGLALLVLLLAFCPRLLLAQPTPAWHDDFADLAGWKPAVADGVGLQLVPDSGRMRMDYDFARGSGYAIARHDFAAPIDLPPNYQFRFTIHARGPRNTLEFKLIDTSGDNVWWVNKRDFDFPAEPSPMALKARHFSFAWGPSGGREPLHKLGAIEIVVTSFNGGQGSVWIDDLRLEPLPVVSPFTGDPAPSVAVTSRCDGEGPLALASDGYLGWTPTPGDAAPTATINFGRVIEFGGLVLEWAPGGHAADYSLEASTDGVAFSPLVSIRGGNGGRDYLAAPDTLASHLRLTLLASGPTLQRIRIMPLEFGNSPTDLLKSVAQDAPRGQYPRAFLNEKSYWTVVGVPQDRTEALINEDGAVELGTQGPSIEPFIYLSGQHVKLLTWAETDNSQSLHDGYLPVPTVRRVLMRGDQPVLELSVTASASGNPDRSTLLLRYQVGNPSASARRDGTLYLALRPMQVNPPEQFLGHPGGASRVPAVSVKDHWIHFGDHSILPLTTPAAFGATAFAQGEIVEHLAAGTLPAAQSAEDPLHLASAALSYPFSLAPGEHRTVWITAPLFSGEALPVTPPAGDDDQRAAACDHALQQSIADWQTRLERVRISLPADDLTRGLWNSIRSNLAYILINADGAGIQPGSRSYERTWIRDGSLTSSALLAFGFNDEVRNFLDWFAPYQYDTGKVPCCVDRRGPDPVPENDSHGQYIFAVLDYYHFTHDTEFLRRHWPRVVKAVDYIEFLRNQRLIPEFATGPDQKRMLYGLLPESISHEGYSAKPMHSYWDDFFTLKGLTDAATIAHELGEPAAAKRFEALRDSFTQTLYDSIALTRKLHDVSYIPGCAELGDFDATSTTVALWPCGQFDRLPQPALGATFDRFVGYFRERRDGVEGPYGGRNSEAYTPYEWRIVGSLVLQDRRDEALELTRWYMMDQRPRGWNHWAEVVWKEPRVAKFIGDMPHTWVGSDFINSVRTMLVYERETSQTLVIGAGLPLEWLRAPGEVSVSGLRTRYGPIRYSITSKDQTTTCRIEPESAQPAGGYELRPPRPDRIARITINGHETMPLNGGIAVPSPAAGAPATIIIEYQQ